MTTKTARTLIFALLSFAVVMPTATAHAAKRPATPTVTRVSPMSANLGDTLTVRGAHFRTGRAKNTVVFKRDGKRAIFVKSTLSTHTMLRVTVPAALSAYLSRSSAGTARPTRVRLRVLAGRFGRSFTSTRLSPRISEARGGISGTSRGAGAPGVAGSSPASIATGFGGGSTDNDGDGLSNTLEAQIGTSPNSIDTDGDGLSDGWEYRSAWDYKNCTTVWPAPCTTIRFNPAQTGFPNPLRQDANVDFDGDSLTEAEEYAAWLRHPGHSLDAPWYSGGLKASIDSDATDHCVGMTPPIYMLPAALGYTLQPGYGYPATLATSGPATCLNDAQRDEDGDLLSNYQEAHGPLSSDEWWNAVYQETSYGQEQSHSVSEGTDWLTSDSDGNGYIDSLDDQDGDRFLNLEEIDRGSASPATSGLWVQPFNPCLPAMDSPACDSYPAVNAQWTPLADSPVATWQTWSFRTQGTPAHLVAKPT